MRVFVLGSGSSGNGLLVESGGTKLLVEAGLGPRVLASRLLELGVELRPGDLAGIVASHQHGDHFGQAYPLASVFQAPLYLHGGLELAAPASRRRRDARTARSEDPPASPAAMEQRKGLELGSPCPPAVVDWDPATAPVTTIRYDVGKPIRVGGLTVTTAIVPHDAAQVAFRVDDGVSAFGVATDVGRVTPALVTLLAGCDAALVEANHCTEMLAFSEYPDVVKRRVGGGFGHLSNAQTAELAARLVGSRLARLWLGHLSRSNNTPARALEVVAERARRIEVEVVPGSSPVALHVKTTRPHQLGLRF